MKKLYLFALGIAFCGCGSQGFSTVSSGSTSPLVGSQATSLSGKVLNEAGGSVAGVRLVAHERTTNQKVKAVSTADGSFFLAMPAGVYDVGLDLENSQTATCFYGPVTVNSATSRDFLLRDSGGRSKEQLFGRLLQPSGSPLANRQVSLRPVALNSNGFAQMPPTQFATTDSNGNFSAQLGPEAVTLDVELYDSQNVLSEWVDVVKLRKPCYVEFLADTPVKNRLRANKGTPRARASVAARSETRARVGDVPFSARMNATFGLLENGLIAVDSSNLQTGDPGTTFVERISANALTPAYTTYLSEGSRDKPSVLVENEGGFFYDYGLFIFIKGHSRWWFTDLTGDTYSLLILDPVQDLHVVYYNSKSADIKEIEFSH